MHSTLRVGIVGLGANTRLRHVPGLRACEAVEILGVVNRRAESTSACAAEFGISRTYRSWQELVADPEIDAVVIGTWPYLHHDVTIAALEGNKHVLCEARMARNLAEARAMLKASLERPHLVAQLVPSPFGLRLRWQVERLLADGYLGDLREVVVLCTTDMLADPTAPLHWRQVAEYSGLNMLALGVLHETLIRWLPDPICVSAQGRIFTPTRYDPQRGAPGPVETPDCVHVLAQFPGGALGIYHASGVARGGPGFQIHLYGSQGTLKCLLGPQEKLLGLQTRQTELREIPISPELEYGWCVEAEFVGAIRGQCRVQHTDFATGVRYMAFTEAVARSIEQRRVVELAELGV
jgi:predicted dehydrogenase